LLAKSSHTIQILKELGRVWKGPMLLYNPNFKRTWRSLESSNAPMQSEFKRTWRSLESSNAPILSELKKTWRSLESSISIQYEF
jgi:hypothetical protein